jgi:hypothetical protein
MPLDQALRLRVELLDVAPMVWRTVLVSVDITLFRLHDVLQAAFGWENRHLHEFRAGDKRWGRPDPQFDPPGSVASGRAQLVRVLPASGRLDYLYDFGDGWEHLIQLQGTEKAAWRDLPRCIAGANACPPEDCGGPHGYEELRRILADPDDPDHAAMRRWAGRYFDPAKFVLATANRRVKRC